MIDYYGKGGTRAREKRIHHLHGIAQCFQLPVLPAGKAGINHLNTSRRKQWFPCCFPRWKRLKGHIYRKCASALPKDLHPPESGWLAVRYCLYCRQPGIQEKTFNILHSEEAQRAPQRLDACPDTATLDDQGNRGQLAQCTA